MCLITDQNEPLIAETDITVYKILYNDNGQLRSTHKNFRWNLDKLYSNNIGRLSGDYRCFDETDYQEIQKKYPDFIAGKRHPRLYYFGIGFHSILTKQRLRKVYAEKKKPAGKEFYECTIPKDSKYYIGISGLVISNQIIINKKIS